ncbi:MAG: hypothetical protein K6A23_09180 [Butyrivibrio sp.]|nr:hypothetical protein [Butyrivibrio sp.]
MNKRGVTITYDYMAPDKDEQVREVFERTDQLMYERKQQLKEMGARTRS